MDGLTLYIVMILGSLVDAFVVAGTVLFILFLICLLGEVENEKETVSKQTKLSLFLSLMFFSCSVLIPTQSQALILYGFPKILQNQKIPEPWEQLVKQNLMDSNTHNNSSFANHCDSDSN